MHHKACRLVEHKQVVILIYYVKRNVFRQYFQPAPLVRHHECDHIPRPHYAVGLGGLAVDPDVVFLYGELDPVAGSVFHMGGEVFVHPHRRLSLVEFKAEMLEHFLFFVLVSFFVSSITVCECQVSGHFICRQHFLHVGIGMIVHKCQKASARSVESDGSGFSGTLVMSLVRYRVTDEPIRSGSSDISGVCL